LPVDIVCVGAQKAGTTWLFSQLSKHPKISTPRSKEINYFGNKSSSYANSFEENYSRGLNWYRDQLNQQPGKLTCDFSPNYLWDSEVPKRIHSDAPSCKILIVLREPVDRAFSQYNHAKKTFYVGAQFEEALVRHPDIWERSFYAEDIERFMELFPEENIKVTYYENLKSDPQKYLEDIYLFLGLPPFLPVGLDLKVNEAKYPRFILFNVLVSTIYAAKRTRIGRMIWSSPQLRKVGNSVVRFIRRNNLRNTSSETVEKGTRAKLNSSYMEEAKKLEKLLGKEVPW
jgi:hypothetical protein